MNIRHTYLFSSVFFLCLLGLVGCRSPQYTSIQQLRQADLSQSIICHWGDFRIPDSKAFDTGAAEFYPYEKYVDFGWELYNELLYADWGTPQYDSLQKLNDTDETWWMHTDAPDLASDYGTKLIRLLKRSKGTITAAELCDIIPSNESEWGQYYDIVETDTTTTKTFNPLELMRAFAAADSTNVLEAYMRMGEYVDGELVEAVFDDYIYLYHRLPQRFAQLRKLRTKRWNEGFKEWKNLYDD